MTFFVRRHFFFPFILLTLCTFCGEVPPETAANFTVTIENLSGTEAAPAAMLGAGVHYRQEQLGSPLFFNRAFDYGDGLEELAEDGNPDSLLTTIDDRGEIIGYERFGNIPPGSSIQFTFSAEYGNRFNFVTMFMESNDLFYSFSDEGISLFEPNGDPVEGDFTGNVLFWDAGTEENETPYEGQFQPPRQSAPGEGVFTPNEAVRPRDDDFSYPATQDVIRITIESQAQ